MSVLSCPCHVSLLSDKHGLSVRLYKLQRNRKKNGMDNHEQMREKQAGEGMG